MKRIITSIFILIAAAVSAIAAEKPDTLKIMTYNLRFGELATMKEIGQYIASETPDIVALQECDWATARKRAPHQNGVKFVNELAYWSGMFVWKVNQLCRRLLWNRHAQPLSCAAQ